MNCRCGCATISRESDTVRPVLTSARAAARRASVMRFTVPRWSSWPQRPQLFSRLKYDSTSACVGSFGPGMLASSREMAEYATPASQLIAKRNQREIERVARAAAAPVVVGDWLREFQVLAEHVGHPRRQRPVHEREVQLVVQVERSVIEIRTADAHPSAVDDHCLGVQ